MTFKDRQRRQRGEVPHPAAPAVPDPAQGAEAAVNSRAFWVVRVITGVAGLGLQLAGLYALYVAFGAWLTLGLYAIGGLAIVLQQLVVRRMTSCSPGD
jgi:hypothetical protein